MQPAHAGCGERGEQQRDDFLVAADRGLAVELAADLHDLARLRKPGRHGSKHAAGVAKPRRAVLVQQMRVDARDLRRDVRAHAEQPSRQRIDDLERLQLEIASGAREQRLEMLDQRRLHEPVAVRAEMIEQRAPKRLETIRLVRQHVLDVLRQDPLAHGVSRGGYDASHA